MSRAWYDRAVLLPRLILPLVVVGLLSGCKNEDYEKCLEQEKQALEKLKKAMDACDQLPDEAKKTECRDQAKSGHFESGCEALK